jgi:hypothetical protein
MDGGLNTVRVLGYAVEGEEATDQVMHVAQRDHVRPVAGSSIGIRMCFDEYSGYANGNSGSR